MIIIEEPVEEQTDLNGDETVDNDDDAGNDDEDGDDDASSEEKVNDPDDLHRKRKHDGQADDAAAQQQTDEDVQPIIIRLSYFPALTNTISKCYAAILQLKYNIA